MLSDLKITKTKPDPLKEIRLPDGEGLHVAILPNGRRFWRWDYTYNGRRKQLSFGKYPRVTLKEARAKKLEAQRVLDTGTDPSVARQREKVSATTDTFAAVAAEWLEREKATLGESTWIAKQSRVDTYLIPALGGRPIARIAPPDVLPLLQAIERLGKRDTAHRVRAMASEIFRYAVTTARAETDPAALLGDALKPITVRHHPSLIEPVAVGQLLTAIDHADGSAVIAGALRLAPLVFLRPGELRAARWAEIDLDAAIWRIPAARMKPTAVRIDHLVPLSTQAIALLRDLRTITGTNPLVFPGVKSAARPISDATLPTVLRRLGYAADVQSIHGFRTLASTHLREIGWENDLVELQLKVAAGEPLGFTRSRIPSAPRTTKRRACPSACG